MVKVVQICALGVASVYKFVYSWLGEWCINLYIMSVLSQLSMKL